MRKTIEEKAYDFSWTQKPFVVQAFKAGFDPIPEWFMDEVTANRVILHTYNETGWCDVMNPNGTISFSVDRSDYIIKGVAQPIACKAKDFEAQFHMGDWTSIYTLAQEMNTEFDILNEFSNTTETYNSLHEDLRELRREITHEAPDEVIKDILFIIGITALKARKDLFK